MLNRPLATALLLACLPLHAEVPNWKVTINIDTEPIPPGQCTSVWVTVKDSNGQPVPDFLGTQNILHRDFKLSIAGLARSEFTLTGDTTRGWMDLCAQKPNSGRAATLVAQYPADSVAPAARWPGIVFNAQLRFESGPARSAGIPKPVTTMHAPVDTAAAANPTMASSAPAPAPRMGANKQSTGIAPAGSPTPSSPPAPSPAPAPATQGIAILGEIRCFAMPNFVPRGWAPLDGRALPIASNTALFTLLGTTYGGNGTSTFALPLMAAPVVGMNCAIATMGVFPDRD